MISSYWLSQWIDENEIHADWEIDHVLRSEKAVKKLEAFINECAGKTGGHYPRRVDVGDSIVAGSKMDLSGTISCGAFECLRDTVDQSFKNLWHYFDKIVVEGLDPRRLVVEYLQRPSEFKNAQMLQSIMDQAKLILYLRSIGAEEYAPFEHKPHMFCRDHWLQHARNLGIEAAFDEKQHKQLVAKIMRSSRLKIEKLAEEGPWHVAVSSQFFDETSHLLINSSSKPTKESVTGLLLVDYATAMIADVGMAREMMLPLVESVDVSWVAKPRQIQAPLSEKDVVLELEFPVFDNLSTADFLKLRADEQPYFERFRASLRQAIGKELTTANAAKSAVEVAAAIENNFLRPGIADIERQVRSSRVALIKKGAISLAIGASAAAIGALSSVPLTIVGGAGVLGTSVPLAPLIYQYIDTRNVTIPISDLYFLWRVGKSQRHR